MTTYRVSVCLKSPLGTEMISGTLWGHVAWAVRYVEGPESFSRWIEEQAVHPWLLSSWMPPGKVPRPLLKPMVNREPPTSLAEMNLEKRAKKVAFISETLFSKLRGVMSEGALTQILKEELRRDGREKNASSGEMLTAHNRIDRLTGTTPEVGGLYFEEVYCTAADGRYQFFVQTGQPCIERLRTLLEFIGDSGFGRNSSTGCGYLHFDLQEENSLFLEGGNRAVSLSHGTVSRNMGDLRYRRHVHFGKLGGDYAKGPFSPFKYPIFMSKPGTTFAPVGEGPFGELLAGVHHDPALAGVRHHALHLPLYFSEVSP